MNNPFKGKKRPEHSKIMKGKGNPNFIDGRSLKKYYCKGCGDKITWQTAIYGRGNCGSCSQQKKKLNKKTKQKIGEAQLKLKHNGKNHWNWQGGKPKCLDCGKRVSAYSSKRCQKCNGENYRKRFSGKNSWLFGKKGKNSRGYRHGKTIKKYYCVDCGNELKGTLAYKHKRCQSCYAITMRGKGNPNFGNGYKIKGKNNPMFGKVSYASQYDYYKRILMRSSYEIKFAQFLDLSGIKYLYEPKRFYFENCTYLPDFYLSDFDCYIEIKGWWRENAKKRFDLFKKNYPKLNIKALMKPDLEKLGVL